MSERSSRLAIWTTLIAIVAGGSTQVEWQAVVMLLAGATMLTCPAVHALPGRIAVPLLLLALLPATAFLPAAWFGEFPGNPLRSDTNIAWGPFLTGQPWITLQQTLALWFALAWGAYLACLDWSGRRARSLRLLIAGITLIAVLTIIQYFTGWKPPFFNGIGEMIGPFPNRNHSGNVFAIAGVASIGLLWNAIDKRLVGIPELGLATVLLGTAATLTGSRAATLLFFVGAGLWFVFYVRQVRTHVSFTVLLSGFLILVTLLFTWGEDYLSRFEQTDNDLAHARTPLQKDALSLAGQTPATGIGLGQFDPVFPLYREQSGIQADTGNEGLAARRAIHPESDWLWLWVECGWIGLGLVFAIIGACTRDVFPLKPNSERAIRSAAGLAFLCFLLHGFGDVPGHLLGTAMPALLLLALARYPDNLGGEQRPRAVWRLCGAMAVTVGILFGGSVWSSRWPLKTSGTADRLRRSGQESLRAGQPEEAYEQFDAAIRIAPLDWRLYYLRAWCGTEDLEQWEQVAIDFRTASQLEPNAVDAAYQEGQFWMRRGFLQIGLIAWRECLNRAAKPKRIGAMVNELRRLSRDPLTLRHILPERTDLWIAYLGSLNQQEFPRAFAALRYKNPQFIGWKPRELTGLFHLLTRSDQPDLRDLPFSHPTFQHVTPWPVLAAFHARQNNFDAVGRLLSAHAPPQSLATVSPDPTQLRRLRGRLLLAPDDLISQVRLYQAEKAVGNTNEALALLEQFCKSTNCPPAMYLERLHRDLQVGDHQSAWETWRQLTAAKARGRSSP